MLVRRGLLIGGHRQSKINGFGRDRIHDPEDTALALPSNHVKTNARLEVGSRECSIGRGSGRSYGHKPTRKEPIRGFDTRLLFALSWATRSGDAVCGKLVNEIVGLAERHQ
jgi:hypothetical protein